MKLRGLKPPVSYLERNTERPYGRERIKYVVLGIKGSVVYDRKIILQD
jgi:hypothetical protein